MSMPKIPDMDPEINIDLGDSINIVIASIGFEELALANLINAESEKIQSFLGSIKGQEERRKIDIEDLIKLDNSVNDTLDSIIKKEFILLMKLGYASNILKECRRC